MILKMKCSIQDPLMYLKSLQVTGFLFKIAKNELGRVITVICFSDCLVTKETAERKEK